MIQAGTLREPPSEVTAPDMIHASLAESIAMHVYIGVDCKQCRKFTVFREIARGADLDDVVRDHQLRCVDGHQNTYVLGDFYTLESSTPYAHRGFTRRSGLWEKFARSGSSKELFLISLLLAQ